MNEPSDRTAPRRLRFGIIGVGIIGQGHAKRLTAEDSPADLIAVADQNPEAAQKIAAEHGVEAAADVTSLLARPDVDAVIIAVPSGLHAEVTIQALDAGKHVFLEKPIEVTVAAADRIRAAEKRSGKVLTIASQRRFAAENQFLKQIIEEGRLGRITSATIEVPLWRSQEYYDSGAWRGTWELDGGGALMNQGIHGVDLLLHLAGPVSRVYARAKTLARKIEVEDTLSAVVDFESGAIGVIQATTSVYPGYPRRLEINGEKGSIALEENSIAKWDIYSGSHEDIVVQPAAFSSASTPTAISLDGHTRQIADMIRAVKTGTRPTIDVYEGRKPVDLILAIYRSAEEGRPIDL